MKLAQGTGKYILDAVGDYGPKFRAYLNTNGTTEGLELITPEGFPHPRQLAYLESTTPNTLWAGQRGSGKTYGAVWDNLFTAYRVPGSVQIIFRRTMSELKRTIIKEFLDLPEDLRGAYTGTVDNPHLSIPVPRRNPDGSVEIVTSEIHFASVNTEEAASKYKGGQFLKVTFDEWAEIPTKWWLYIKGSARPGRLDKDVVGRQVMSQIKGLSNPGGVGSDALKHLFGAEYWEPKLNRFVPECEKSCPKNLDLGEYISEDYTFIPSLLDDNPTYSADTAAGRAYRTNLKSQPAAIRNAWLYGRWSGFEGMYFDCYDREVTIIPHDKVLTLMAKQWWMPVFLGIDVGTVHHAYICWNTLVELPLADGTKKIFVVTFDELLLKGRSERALAGEILDRMRDNDKLKKRINRIWLSPETFGEGSKTRARVIGDEFVMDGVIRPISAKAEKHSRVNGLRSMYTLLAERNLLLDPMRTTGTDSDFIAPDWIVSENCPELLEALPWAASDPNQDGDIRKEGDDPKLDVLDGTRYAIYSHHVSGEKPATEVYREKMELITQGGITPNKSMRLFAEHMRRQKELRDGKSELTQVGKYARQRHPRIGRTNTPKGTGGI